VVHKTARTYGQYCPIAVGLDVLGDRWTLLVCRELVIGDRRFSDLRRALPGIAPNLLSERLRSLQSAGVVATVELPPPAARTVYRLTERGRDVLPVLRAVARFGVNHLDSQAPGQLSARRVAHSLLAPWRRSTDATLRARLIIDDGDQTDVIVDGTDTRVVPAANDADVTFTVTAGALVRARQGDGTVEAQLTGTADKRNEFLAAFNLRLARRRHTG
jgi:DNA-binding HxlR family transcriptional regulator